MGQAAVETARQVAHVKCSGTCEKAKEEYIYTGVEAVSYTHLDVYKRQDQMRAELLVQAREKMENLEESSGLSRERIKKQLESKLGRLDDVALIKDCLLYTSRCV